MLVQARKRGVGDDRDSRGGSTQGHASPNLQNTFPVYLTLQTGFFVHLTDKSRIE